MSTEHSEFESAVGYISCDLSGEPGLAINLGIVIYRWYVKPRDRARSHKIAYGWRREVWGPKPGPCEVKGLGGCGLGVRRPERSVQRRRIGWGLSG